MREIEREWWNTCENMLTFTECAWKKCTWEFFAIGLCIFLLFTTVKIEML